MWPFFRKQKRATEAVGRRPLAFSQLVDAMGDYSDLRDHDVAIKFWLPEPAREALREIADRYSDTVSGLLRQYLAVHCYGLYAVNVMTDKYPRLFRESDILFARRAPDESDKVGKVRVDTYWVPELGKNVAAIKLWLPSRMRDDLQTLADHIGIPLSQYLREIVIARLLGHGTLPGRPKMFDALPTQAAEDWCADREVPWQEVPEDAFWQADERKRVTTWRDP